MFLRVLFYDRQRRQPIFLFNYNAIVGLLSNAQYV